MKGWEYKWVELTEAWSLFGGPEGGCDASQLESALNDLGRQGWELVSALDNGAGQVAKRVVALLKRPLP